MINILNTRQNITNQKININKKLKIVHFNNNNIIIKMIFIIVILSITLIYLYNKYQYNINYRYLLESPKNYSFNNQFIKNIENNPLVECMHDFCIKNNIYTNGIIVSLSGGVDSMVVLAIMLHLQTKYSFKIFTATIDYGLRDESKYESEFLKKHTKMFGIKSYVSYIEGISRKQNDSCKRNEFEEASRNLRFDTYKKIMQENNLTDCGVMVAHHKDDIVENIFTNIMKGGNILDLEVMKQKSVINGVNILRPLLEFKKQVIYDFAHTYDIPYFLDTTPKWSKRGKMRNEIFPLIESVFGDNWTCKFKMLGNQSNEWSSYINDYIVNPWFSEIEFGTYGFIIPIKNDQPQIIFSNVLLKGFHKIGENMIKKTSQDKLINYINMKNNQKQITLDSGRMGLLIKNNQYLMIFNYLKIKNKNTFTHKMNFNYINFINGIK